MPETWVDFIPLFTFIAFFAILFFVYLKYQESRQCTIDFINKIWSHIEEV